MSCEVENKSYADKYNSETYSFRVGAYLKHQVRIGLGYHGEASTSKLDNAVHDVAIRTIGLISRGCGMLENIGRGRFSKAVSDLGKCIGNGIGLAVGAATVIAIVGTCGVFTFVMPNHLAKTRCHEIIERTRDSNDFFCKGS